MLMCCDPLGLGSCLSGDMIFEFDRDELIVLDAAAAKKATEDLIVTHGIPSNRSKDLTPESETPAPASH
jgi:hypothetical protein